MEKEIFLVEELENRLAIEGVRYKHQWQEDWENVKFDPTYFDTFISGPLYAEFITAIYDRIKPLNNHEINRFLTLSVAQFKTHTPQKREREFILNYWHTYWFPNKMDDKVSEYDEKYAKHILKHFTKHFHLFQEATEKALADFKNGLIGFTEFKPMRKGEPTVQDFFEKVKEGNLTQLEIYNQVQKFTDNFDLTKLEILFQDFEFFLFVEKEERLGEFSKEEITKALSELEKKKKPIPFIEIPKLPTIGIKHKKDKTDKIIDVEKLLYPYDFFTCYQFSKFLTSEIKNRRAKETIPTPKTNQKPTNNSVKTAETFDTLLPQDKASFILTMLDELSITVNGKPQLSERRKGALRGTVEALIEKSILPQQSIHSLCLLIADKIGLELKSKLDYSTISETFRKKALSYISQHQS